MSEIVKTTAEAQPTPGQAPAVAPETTTAPAVKTFTQEELDRILDKRLARERADNEAKIQAAVTEAQKLAKLSAEERAQHERQKAEEALKGREIEITRRELRAQALETLAEKGIPKELAEVLPYTDADSTSAAITAVEKAFRTAVEKAVNDRLKGAPPAAGINAPRLGERERLEAEWKAAKDAKDPIKMLNIAAQIKRIDQNKKE